MTNTSSSNTNIKNSFKDTIIYQCLDILKREDIKREMKLLFQPVVEYIWYEINPYMNIILAFVFILFVLNLAIFIILVIILRNKERML
jgi:hypothetical protein